MEDPEQIEMEEELSEEVEDKINISDFFFTVLGLVIAGMIFVFTLSSLGLIWNETDDTPTLEAIDWNIDAHSRKFLMMDDNGSWSYEYEFNFDVWVYSKSNGGGYPHTWICIYYIVNNKTIEEEFIYISGSESGSASHHQKRLITNYRVTEDDDVKIILEFPQSGFEWVDGANDFTRYSWLIVYEVDVGTEEGDP